MTARDYIAYFESKPESEWITGTLGDAVNRHCAVGWFFKDNPNSVALKLSFGLRTLFGKHHFHGPECVNDGWAGTEIFGSTPRERILTVLNQIALFEDVQDEKDTDISPVADLVLV